MKNKHVLLILIPIIVGFTISNIFLIKDIFFSKFEVGKCYQLTSKDPFNRVDYYAKVIDYKQGHALLRTISYKFINNEFQYSFAYVTSETNSFSRLYKKHECGAFDSEFTYLMEKQNEN